MGARHINDMSARHALKIPDALQLPNNGINARFLGISLSQPDSLPRGTGGGETVLDPQRRYTLPTPVLSLVFVLLAMDHGVAASETVVG